MINYFSGMILQKFANANLTKSDYVPCPIFALYRGYTEQDIYF